MGNLNQVHLIGRLTKEPETKSTKSGTSICSMSLAINEKYTTSSGEKKEKATFIDVESWASLADLCAKYLTKGSSMYVGGRLELDQWETPEGQKRQRLKVVASNVQFLDGVKSADGQRATRHTESNNGSDDVPF
jgi:single-strand DNA-binding protein